MSDPFAPRFADLEAAPEGPARIRTGFQLLGALAEAGDPRGWPLYQELAAEVPLLRAPYPWWPDRVHLSQASHQLRCLGAHAAWAAGLAEEALDLSWEVLEQTEGLRPHEGGFLDTPEGMDKLRRLNWWHLRGVLLERTGKPGRAKACFERALTGMTGFFAESEPEIWVMLESAERLTPGPHAVRLAAARERAAALMRLGYVLTETPGFVLDAHREVVPELRTAW